MPAAAFAAIVAGFFCGIFVRSYHSLGLATAAFIAILAVALFFLSRAERVCRKLVPPLFLLFLALGIVRMDAAVIYPEPLLSARMGETVTVEGDVFQEPDVRERSQRIYMRADTLAGGTAINAGVLVIAPRHAKVQYGDRIKAHGVLETPKSFESGSGRPFDYPGYLAKDGILYELTFAQVEAIGEGKKNAPKAFAISVKQKYLAGLGAVLEEPHAGLAGGITAGDKRSIGKELSEAFRATGLTHILVLSGYNISIVMDALSRWASSVPTPAQMAGNFAVVLFFIFMTGGTATAVRAGAMALIAVYARRSGRVYIPLRILAVVAAAMVLWDPYILAFDPGFQLSVLATAGLILLTPFFSKKFSRIPARWGLREIAAATVAAQLAVLPLLLYQTGILPIFSLPANVLVLVAVPYAMALSAFAAVAGIILGPSGVVLALPAQLLLSYIIAVAHFLGSLPFASVSIPNFGTALLCIAYIILGSLALYIHVHQKSAS